jgi:hypothetical protein
VEDDIEEGTVNFQAVVVVDQAQLAKLVHEKAD